MRAVSNTSPLSALTLIGRLGLLELQFSELWIPPAVSEELDAHPHDVAGSLCGKPWNRDGCGERLRQIRRSSACYRFTCTAARLRPLPWPPI